MSQHTNSVLARKFKIKYYRNKNNYSKKQQNNPTKKKNILKNENKYSRKRRKTKQTQTIY